MHIGKYQITKRDLVWFIICLFLVLCGFIGLFVFNNDSAAEILSGASTAISIVLSIVAILYTMIEGANSSKINHEAIAKLNQLDLQIEQISRKTIEMSELKTVLNDVIPKVDTVVKNIGAVTGSDDLSMFDDKTKESIEHLRRYICEDIDD